MMYHTPPTKNSLQKQAVALAFPDMVDMVGDHSDASFQAHWNDASGEDYSALSFCVDETRRSHQPDGVRSISLDEGSVYTSRDDDIEIASNARYSIQDSHEPSPNRFTSPTQTATTVAISNISAIHRGRLRKHPKTKAAPSQRPGRLTIWEKVLISMVLLIMSACVSVTVVVIVRHWNSKGSTSSLATVPPFPIATTATNDNATVRLESIRAWLQVDPAPGTPQDKASHWLAEGDLTYILGDPIPSKQQYDDMKNNSSLNTGKEYAAMEAFRVHITQRYALLVFFFTAIVDGIALGGWASITGARLPECLWPGVDCIDQDVVTGLEISSSLGFLQGSLPTELGLLSKLGMYCTISCRSTFVDILSLTFSLGFIAFVYICKDRLMLSYNSLSGEIPSTLYDLSNLRTYPAEFEGE
jgi:hypothetical protein